MQFVVRTFSRSVSYFIAMCMLIGICIADTDSVISDIVSQHNNMPGISWDDPKVVTMHTKEKTGSSYFDTKKCAVVTSVIDPRIEQKIQVLLLIVPKSLNIKMRDISCSILYGNSLSKLDQKNWNTECIYFNKLARQNDDINNYVMTNGADLFVFTNKMEKDIYYRFMIQFNRKFEGISEIASDVIHFIGVSDTHQFTLIPSPYQYSSDKKKGILDRLNMSKRTGYIVIGVVVVIALFIIYCIWRSCTNSNSHVVVVNGGGHSGYSGYY